MNIAVEWSGLPLRFVYELQFLGMKEIQIILMDAVKQRYLWSCKFSCHVKIENVFTPILFLEELFTCSVFYGLVV